MRMSRIHQQFTITKPLRTLNIRICSLKKWWTLFFCWSLSHIKMNCFRITSKSCIFIQTLFVIISPSWKIKLRTVICISKIFIFRIFEQFILSSGGIFSTTYLIIQSKRIKILDFTILIINISLIKIRIFYCFSKKCLLTCRSLRFFSDRKLFRMVDINKIISFFNNRLQCDTFWYLFQQ